MNSIAEAKERMKNLSMTLSLVPEGVKVVATDNNGEEKLTGTALVLDTNPTARIMIQAMIIAMMAVTFEGETVREKLNEPT